MRPQHDIVDNVGANAGRSRDAGFSLSAGTFLTANARAIVSLLPKTTPKRTDVLIALAIGTVPLVVLLPTDATFYIDWSNSVWIVGYVGEYVARHGTFPTTISTNQAVGIPLPIFYAFLFLPIAGSLSALTGADISVRIICVLAMFGQTLAIVAVCKRAGIARQDALIVAALFAWRPYPLSNLYNRGDITEFVAFALLVIGLALFFLYPSAKRWGIRAVTPGLFFVLAAGTGPTTGALGAVLFGLCAAVLIALAAKENRSSILIGVSANVVLVAVVLSPWLFATASFSSHLRIAGAFPALNYYPSIDTLWNRLVPFPFDPRSLFLGTAVPTPYLDVQIAVPLAVLAFTALALRRKEPDRHATVTGLVALAAAVCILLVSGAPGLAVFIPYLHVVQFAYRLVNYCDLALLISVCAALANTAHARFRRRQWVSLILVGCTSAGLLSVGVKLTHAAAVESLPPVSGSGGAGGRSALLDLPHTFYGLYDYSTGSGLSSVEEPSSENRIPLETDPVKFGLTGNAEVASSGVAGTNVEVFPWNRITLDGQVVPVKATLEQRGYTIAVKAVAGARLGYAVVPDKLWRQLRIASALTLVGWIVAALLSIFTTGFGMRSRVLKGV